MQKLQAEMVKNMIFKILLIIMLVLPFVYLAFTLVINLVDEIINIGKRQVKKTEVKDDRRYDRYSGTYRRDNRW